MPLRIRIKNVGQHERKKACDRKEQGGHSREVTPSHWKKNQVAKSGQKGVKQHNPPTVALVPTTNNNCKPILGI